MIIFFGRMNRSSIALLISASAVPLTIWSAQPAVAATTCTFTSGSGVHTKSWFLGEASRTKSIHWDIGRTISADRFGQTINGATRPYHDQWRRAAAWYPPNVDYSLPVDTANDSCRSIAIVTTGTNAHLWFDICVAPAVGQMDSVCTRSLPDNLSGLMYAGVYNAHAQKVATNPNGTYFRT